MSCSVRRLDLFAFGLERSLNIRTFLNLSITGLLSFEMLVRLNVGGTVFITTDDTILSRGPSMLSVLIRHDNPAQKIEGIMFIDRDPLIFRWVLNYLRGSNILPLRDTPELWQLKEEAEYFAIDALSLRIQHALCPSFKKEDNVMVRGTKFTVASTDQKGYVMTRLGIQYKIDASETVEHAQVAVKDNIMVWDKISGKRMPGLCLNIHNKLCTVQFKHIKTPTQCPILGIRF